jgi:hypothetical protein
MPITKEDVLQVLGDPKLHSIRFSVGPIQVNSVEYDKVSDYIEAGAIDVAPGKASYSKYIPQKDTLVTRIGNPPLNEDARTNLLHECTHAIADINECDVTRLTDEAAAYLAQVAYLLLLMPSLPEPPIGLPINNVMRQVMRLVNSYELGSPAGYGATINQRDIADLARVIYGLSDYHDIDPKEKLAADGLSLSDKQSEEFYQRQMQRFMKRDASDRDMEEERKRITTKVQGVSYENYVTSDEELRTLFDSYRRGGDAQKKTALQKLLRIFLTIDQRSAVQLVQRLSAARKGDIVSERFQSGLPASERTTLLAALRLTR